jgi:hypothetical protein
LTLTNNKANANYFQWDKFNPFAIPSVHVIIMMTSLVSDGVVIYGESDGQKSPDFTRRC